MCYFVRTLSHMCAHSHNPLSLPDALPIPCASPQGAPIHVERVNRWLADLGLGDDDLCCGPQVSRDTDLKWGVDSAVTTPNPAVSDYTYNTDAFLNLIAGSPAPRAYSTEDTPRPEVDPPPPEGSRPRPGGPTKGDSGSAGGGAQGGTPEGGGGRGDYPRI